MRLSVVIATHGRLPALRQTLGELASPGRLPADHEVIVVDNASPDNTAGALAAEYPYARVIRRATNEGVAARNHGIRAAQGEYVLLVDDDSYPLGATVPRAMAYLDGHPATGALGGRVELPDGRCEASALPSVPINCGVILRKSAIDRVGGFPTEFGRQAEEYDLAFRLWDAGYRVERFEDLCFRHNKAPGNRAPARVLRLDLRNNLILLERYVPEPLRSIYRRDWTQRYAAFARHHGHRGAAFRGYVQGRSWGLRERLRGRRTLSPAAIEAVFEIEAQAGAVARWAVTSGVRRVVIADLSKNLHATWRACRDSGLDAVAVADSHPAFRGGMTYRGLPVIADDDIPAHRPDGIVLSTTNPAQAGPRLAALRARFDVPVLCLFEPRTLGDGAPHASAPAATRTPSPTTTAPLPA